jgi:hypothetical protein
MLMIGGEAAGGGELMCSWKRGWRPGAGVGVAWVDGGGMSGRNCGSVGSRYTPTAEEGEDGDGGVACGGVERGDEELGSRSSPYCAMVEMSSECDGEGVGRR